MINKCVCISVRMNKVIAISYTTNSNLPALPLSVVRNEWTLPIYYAVDDVHNQFWFLPNRCRPLLRGWGLHPTDSTSANDRRRAGGVGQGFYLITEGELTGAACHKLAKATSFSFKFGQLECFNLIDSSKFTGKTIDYLGSWVHVMTCSSLTIDAENSRTDIIFFSSKQLEQLSLVCG